MSLSSSWRLSAQGSLRQPVGTGAGNPPIIVRTKGRAPGAGVTGASYSPGAHQLLAQLTAVKTLLIRRGRLEHDDISEADAHRRTENRRCPDRRPIRTSCRTHRFIKPGRLKTRLLTRLITILKPLILRRLNLSVEYCHQAA